MITQFIKIKTLMFLNSLSEASTETKTTFNQIYELFKIKSGF